MATNSNPNAPSTTRTPTPADTTDSDADATPDESGGAVVSVVLPTLNERKNLPGVLGRIRSVFETDYMQDYRPYEVIIVDGGSDDGTREFIRSEADADERVRGLFLRKRFGQSPALAAGFDHATGDYIIPMDADGQNDPYDIPDLLEEIESGYDCVSGWRQDRQDPWHKTIPSAIQTHLAKKTGPDINDFGCTLKAYRAEALGDIDLYGEGHRYIPAKLHKLGYKVTELPVQHHPREHGESRYGAGRLVRGFVDLLFHAWWNRYSSRPFHFLGAAAFVMLAVGGVLAGESLVSRLLFAEPLMPHLPRLIAASLLLVFGLQLLVFGVLAEMLTKLYYRDDREYRVEERYGFEPLSE